MKTPEEKPKPKNTAISAQLRAKIIAYKGPHVEAARALGVSKTTAGRIRREAGVQWRAHNLFSDEETNKVLELHAKGWTHVAIAQAVGRSTHSVTGKLGSMGYGHKPSPVKIDPKWQRALDAFDRQFKQADRKGAA